MKKIIALVATVFLVSTGFSLPIIESSYAHYGHHSFHRCKQACKWHCRFSHNFPRCVQRCVRRHCLYH